MPHYRNTVAALFLFTIPAVTTLTVASAATMREVSSFTLDNGLQVVVIPDHRAPVVQHMVWYKVGGADDPRGSSGIAHFLEHLMFRGTASHPTGEFSERIRALGGNDNASTRYDATEYHQAVASQHLGLMMELEADRMANLQISDDDVRTEREVVREERRSRVDNEPGSILSEAMNAALFRNSAYGTPVIGWPDEIAALDAEDARAFYDRYYTPNNAIVVVAGDVTPDEVRTLAEATYGQLPRRAEPPPRARLAEPPITGPITVTYADERVTEPSVRRAWLLPSPATSTVEDDAATDLLAEILGGSTTSRIYRELVVDRQIAASAGASADTGRIGEGVFFVWGRPRDDTTPDELLAAFQELITDVAVDGVTDDELDRAKRRNRARTAYQQDNVGSLARMYGENLALGYTIEDVQSWDDVVDSVTAEQVAAVARTYLDPERSVTGYLTTKQAENRS